MNFPINEFDATPGETVNTASIQAAIDAAAAAEGGRVVVPPGIWRTGTIWLRSGVELHLAHSAVLKGTNDPADYPERDHVAEGAAVSRRVGPRRMVGAVDCEDIAITGSGTIDGDGGCGGRIKSKWGAEGHPQNIQFVACRRAAVRDIAIKNAGSWAQQYHACEQLRITGISVWNHGNKTNDGLDLDGCTDVRVSDIDIDSHDDALVFKSTGPTPCRNITVTNCRLRSNCHGIKFGTESVGGFQNIRVSNCIVTPSRIPSPMPSHPDGRPVITGCALECTDGGVMRQVAIDGLIVEDVLCPVFVKLGNRMDRRLDENHPPDTGVIEDISITNILARKAGPYPCHVTGYPDHPVRRVHLSNIRIQHVGGVTEDEILDEIPENSAGYPEINMFTKKTDKHLPAHGLYLRHVDQVTVRDFHVALTEPDARPRIVSEMVNGLDVIQSEPSADR